MMSMKVCMIGPDLVNILYTFSVLKLGTYWVAKEPVTSDATHAVASANRIVTLEHWLHNGVFRKPERRQLKEPQTAFPRLYCKA